MTQRGQYAKWSEYELQIAIAAYKNGNYGLNECSRVYGIPKATLRRHAMEKNIYANGVRALGRRAIFSQDMENILATHIVMLEECFFGLTIKDFRKLAFDLAEKYELPHTFNKEEKMAGKKWFYAFLRRNPQLSVRQPEATSLARAKGFNKESVHNFFDLLETTITKYDLTSDRIFNIDESGFTTTQRRPQKILAKKGKHQVGVVASGERGVNTTVVCAVNAAGSYIPPMIIFKAKKWNNAFEVGAPPGSIVKISDTGYINSELFLTWLKHFKNNANCNRERKLLLLLDGHTTHSKNLAAITFAKENGIILLQLPSHTTHRLQPLDVAIFGPFQTYFIQAQEKFLNTYKGHQIRQTNISPLINEAYGKAATVANAQSAFRATGIWPVDRNIFEEQHFAPANALHQTEQTNEATISENDPNGKTNDGSLLEESDANKKTMKHFQKCIDIISPRPTLSKAPSVARTRKTRAQTAVVLTSSPYEEILQKSKKTKLMPKQKQIQATNDEDSGWFCFLCKKISEEDMIQCLQCHRWVHTNCAKVPPQRKIYYCRICKT